MKPLDFIIIGAKKGGTTSLFKYLDRAVRVLEALYERLVALFAPDVARLEALIGSAVPWDRLRGGCAP